jgi:hypothetical protein
LFAKGQNAPVLAVEERLVGFQRHRADVVANVGAELVRALFEQLEKLLADRARGRFDRRRPVELDAS